MVCIRISINFIKLGLGETLKQKIKKFPRYNDIKGLWLDADHVTDNGWKWRHVITPFNGNFILVVDNINFSSKSFPTLQILQNGKVMLQILAAVYHLDAQKMMV